jgi:hypothetical protein
VVSIEVFGRIPPSEKNVGKLFECMHDFGTTTNVSKVILEVRTFSRKNGKIWH